MNIDDNEILSLENNKQLNAKKFGLTIKKIREKKEMEAQFFAKQLGVSPSYITKIEQGKVLNPQPEVVKKIANILDIDYLLLYLELDYIDKKTYKSIELEKGNFAITNVPIYKKVDLKDVSDSINNKVGKIQYLSKIKSYKNLNGYIIHSTPTIFGKPKYTYAIVDLNGKIENGKIGLFNLNGRKILKTYFHVEGKELLIDPEDRSNIYALSSEDKLELCGLLIDFIIDMDGSKLKG